MEDILAIAKVEKGDVLYVGDSGIDMLTAKNARITAVGVTWGFRPLAELEEFEPAHIVNKAEEILSLL